MKFSGIAKRINPVLQKVCGSLPLTPWSSVLSRFDPRELQGVPPPMNIKLIAEAGELKQLRFNNKHDAWFPEKTRISADLWNEYLSVFWPHRANGHYYLRNGSVINSGDVCLDCGSCEGFFAFQALEAKAAKVILIEPSATMANCLRKTFAADIAAGRVVVVNAAVGAAEGSTTFAFDDFDPFSGKPAAIPSAIKISVTTITKLFSDLELKRLDFIKMDIEGAEIQALEGSLPLLERLHPKLAITTYHRPFDYIALHAIAKSAGYPKITPVGLVDRGVGVFRPAMLHAHL